LSREGEWNKNVLDPATMLIQLSMNEATDISFVRATALSIVSEHVESRAW
jgi:hypothetical protein